MVHVKNKHSVKRKEKGDYYLLAILFIIGTILVSEGIKEYKMNRLEVESSLNKEDQGDGSLSLSSRLSSEREYRNDDKSEVQSKTNKSKMNGKYVENKVNRNLFLTEKQIELSEQKRRNELGYLNRSISINSSNSLQKGGGSRQDMLYDASHAVDRYEFQSTRDVQIGREKIDYYSPSSEIYRNLHNEELIQKETQKGKEQYAKDFKENALRAGWDIQLDSNYMIRSIKPISKTPYGRNPSSTSNSTQKELPNSK